MNVLDFDGTCEVESDQGLLDRLRPVRRGARGAFILDHGWDESLWLHINGDAAPLGFCTDLTTDAIVNAANSDLRASGGVYGANHFLEGNAESPSTKST